MSSVRLRSYPLPSADGGVAQRPRSDRLFFAVLPDAPAARRIERLAHDLRGDLGLSGQPIARERLHVTLFFVGDFAGFPGHVIDVLCKAANAATSVPPFKLGFDRVASFSTRDRRRRPMVLQGDDGVLALTDLHETLVGAMAAFGLASPAPRRYTPHLTLLYDDRDVAGVMVDPIVWTVREFVLVHSLIGQSRHEVLARLPLQG